MAVNETRRVALADSGIRVLARHGARGLTHRAVDRAAGVPTGTTSNYFRSRAELIDALVSRIGERLSADPRVLGDPPLAAPTRALFVQYLREIVERLSRDPDVTLALFELRLEAARNPEVESRIGTWLREGFAADVSFNAAAGFPGGAETIALLRYAIDGLMLDRLTTSIGVTTATDEVIERLVDGFLPSFDQPSRHDSDS